MKKVANSRGEEKLFNFRPTLFVAFFLVFGVTFAYYRLLYGISHFWLLTLSPLLLLPLVFSVGICDFLLRLRAVFLLCACFGMGFILFRAQVTKFQTAPKYVGEITAVGEVENYKRQTNRVRLTMKNLRFDEEEIEGRMVVYLSTYQGKDLQVGDRLLLVGEVSTNAALQGDYGFLQQEISRNIYYEMQSADTCVKVGKSNDPFLVLRARLEEVTYAGMDEAPAALTLALLTGDVSGVEDDLMGNMQYGGISHIFAVSGLNVGALFGCCILLFRKTFLKRAPKCLRFLLLIGVLFFYCGVCTFSASVVRAAITCAVLYFTRLFGVGNDPYNALGLAAILILFISPVELMNVGFQLSFLACFGLFLFTKRVGYVFDEVRKLYRKYFPRRYTEEEKKVLADGDTLPRTMGERVWQWSVLTLSASIAAQLTTLPLLMIYFNRISGWSLILNFFFVPVTDALFTLLLWLTAICCLLPTVVSGVLLYLPSLVWSAAILVFEAVDFSTFAISGLQITFGACVCYYGALLLGTDKLQLPKGVKRVVSILLWSAFVAALHLCNL